MLKKLWTFIKAKLWYLALLIGTTVFVVSKRNILVATDLKTFTPYALIFIMWIALLTLPLFSEMELFGVKLKKEVREARTEIKEGLSNIKLQMLELQFSNSIANTIQIGSMPPLASEKELKELKEEVLKSQKTKKSPSQGEIDYGVSKQSILLFQTRLALEKLVTELCEKTDYVGNKSLYPMLRYLNMCELIDGNIFELANQIIKIANRGVHGEIVIEDYIDFVNTVFPHVQQHLLNALNTLN